ncbi:hypothetical protein [Sphingobacterium wenxiniae]|uniref:Uncharacterized protein n=1 Tax=Sphingobacterium wenxiniae TaxID=683125 RepID=A0A1I6VII6_9SPHI|nr:hypothetical protein [Sphingobacterium wenxiniae]SFT13538.1 hypothetical protein SAMN05660206_11435 [Sphingobacterium wenxiniae]
MKLTPLNIVLACFLAWCVSEWGNDQLQMTWWAILLMVVLLIVCDLLFRIVLKDFKRLWMGQIGFVLIAGILMVVIRVMIYK